MCWMDVLHLYIGLDLKEVVEKLESLQDHGLTGASLSELLPQDSGLGSELTSRNVSDESVQARKQLSISGVLSGTSLERPSTPHIASDTTLSSPEFPSSPVTSIMPRSQATITLSEPSLQSVKKKRKIFSGSSSQTPQVSRDVLHTYTSTSTTQALSVGEDEDKMSQLTGAEHEDKLIADMIQSSIVLFIKCTDLDHLSQYLSSAGVLSEKDLQDLQKFPQRSARVRFFYFCLLSKKDVGVYKKLLLCLKEDKDHGMHQELASVIENGISKGENRVQVTPDVRFDLVIADTIRRHILH